MSASGQRRDDDHRFMAAAIRLSRKYLGLTGTNPSVGTLVVKDGIIVGRGVTALGGRPHAETQALAQAGERASGATAYVTLEPCAHHGRTPPCAEALVTAGIRRVVGAASDPDPRVAGRGYAMLRAAGIEVVENMLHAEAAELMAGYLIRSVAKRPEVILKLAVSADGMIGRRGDGQVEITGPLARAQAHALRAESDAILVGIGTALADDPALTCRLPGLEQRSPIRIVLDAAARLPVRSKLVRTARRVPLLLAAEGSADAGRRAELWAKGAEFLAVEMVGGRIALPEPLEDLGQRGVATLVVEGGAETARQFLGEDLVDRIVLFSGAGTVGEGGISSPLLPGAVPPRFRQVARGKFGADGCEEWVRER